LNNVHQYDQTKDKRFNSSQMKTSTTLDILFIGCV